ncbi:MAG TPA: hypothetical protein VJ768_08845 [Anaerolineales bacterium]|nr:hypothetical protein [Anaerolineales bacterium]
MSISERSTQTITVDGKDHSLRFLRPKQIVMIDEALAAIHDIGEIRMVVEKNRMRLIITQRGLDATKWQAGSVADTSG